MSRFIEMYNYDGYITGVVLASTITSVRIIEDSETEIVSIVAHNERGERFVLQEYDEISAAFEALRGAILPTLEGSAL